MLGPDARGIEGDHIPVLFQQQVHVADRQLQHLGLGGLEQSGGRCLLVGGRQHQVCARHCYCGRHALPRFGSGRRGDVGRKRSCSVLLTQHFSHVSPGREQLSETSTASCEHRSYGARVLNGTKSIPPNSAITAERYRSPRPAFDQVSIRARQAGFQGVALLFVRAFP